MIGRPDVEPRTLRFFMAEVCFGTGRIPCPLLQIM